MASKAGSLAGTVCGVSGTRVWVSEELKVGWHDSTVTAPRGADEVVEEDLGAAHEVDEAVAVRVGEVAVDPAPLAADVEDAVDAEVGLDAALDADGALDGQVGEAGERVHRAEGEVGGERRSWGGSC